VPGWDPDPPVIPGNWIEARGDRTCPRPPRRPAGDRAALVAAVLAAPDDDTPRLVLADCLDEHGEPGRAALIRVPEPLVFRRDPLLPGAGFLWSDTRAGASGGPRTRRCWPRAPG